MSRTSTARIAHDTADAESPVGEERPPASAVHPAPAPPTEAPRRRLRGDARRATIIDAAVAAFAQRGFSVSTRDLAGDLGVTQALLYRYFDSKEAIVDAVLDRFARRRWPADFATDLVEGDDVLRERLTRFYVTYSEGVPSDGLRLFVRAALDGVAIGARFGPMLTEDVLRPVIIAMRRETGLPALEERPMVRGERELVMGLHGSIVYMLYRRHVFGQPLPASSDELVRLRVRSFLPGALDELRRVHGDEAAASLTVHQLRPNLA